MPDTTIYPSVHSLVREFHETYGQPIRTTPTMDVPERKMRVALVQEEATEYAEAEANDDLIEIADALGDIVYVAVGALLTHGIDPDLLGEQWIFDPFVPHPTTPTLDIPDRKGWVERMAGEVSWYAEAEAEGNLKQLQLALTFIINIAYEAAHAHGINLDAVLAEIQRSNMSKLGEDGKPIYRADGKVLKGKNFFAPDIAAVLAQQKQ